MALGHYTVSRLIHALKGDAHTFGPKLSREQDRNRHRLEAGTADVADLGEILIGEDRRIQGNLPAALRLRLQQVAFRTDCSRGGSNQLLTDGIDRRIGYLREHLFKVVV